MDIKDRLKDFYNIFPWEDDPESSYVRDYYEFSKKLMDKVLSEVNIDRFKKRKLKILEICSGSGFGGVALSKRLIDKGIRVHLLMTDLREDALERGVRFAEREGVEAEYRAINALSIEKIKDKFDMLLLWGLSSPHFSPQEIVKLFASVSLLLKKDGIFIMNESDRRGSIFLKTGYKLALGEERGEKFVMSFHTGYDPYRGTFKRRYVSLNGSTAEEELYLWGIAELSTFLTLFFKEVKIIPVQGTYLYLIISRKPIKKILPEDIKEPLKVQL